MNQIQSKHKIVGALESLQGGRSENQDFMGFADTPVGFVMVLCDGMGGGPGGRTASHTVVDSVINTLSSCKKNDDVEAAMRKAIELADKRIEELTVRAPQLQGMGTTIVLLVINAHSAHVAHVGDSRLYQFRSKRKVFRTSDHSLVGELVRKGELTEEQARISSNANIITRAINGRGIANPDVTELPYENGDRFALCTDGIWGCMPEKELTDRLSKSKSVSGTVMQATIEADQIGKANGGTHDNLSLAVIDTTTDSKLRVKMGKRTKKLLATIVALLSISVLANIQQAWTLHDSSAKNGIVISKQEERIKQLIDDSIKLSKKYAVQGAEAQAASKAKESQWKNKEEALKKKECDSQHKIKSLTRENDKLKNEINQLKSGTSSNSSGKTLKKKKNK